MSRAIQASLELWQLRRGGELYANDEEAIEEACSAHRRNGRRTDDDDDDSDQRMGRNDIDALEDTAEQMKLALRLSEQQQMEEEQRRLLEEETFRQVLELSLTEK